jgi:hypothetical protein
LAFKHSREPAQSTPSFLPLTIFPFTAVFESRADLGSEALALKTSRKLVSIDVSLFELTEKLDLLVGNSETSIEGGECYLVTQQIEETI